MKMTLIAVLNAVILVQAQSMSAARVESHFGSSSGSDYTYQVNSPRPKVLYDFDMDSDIDDVVDAVLLLNLEHIGKLDIVGGIATSPNPAGPCFLAIANYYGRSSIPVGVNINGGGNSTDRYASNIATNYGVPGFTNNAQFPNYLTVQRQILADSSDNSIEYITTGTLRSVQGLLQSGSDGISPLTGLQLVAQKVRHLWVVAGNWPSGTAISDFGECSGCAAVSFYVVTTWPTTVPIVFDSISDGNGVLTGGNVMVSMNSSNPARVAWEVYFGNSSSSNTRPGWSQIAIMPMSFGVYPNSTTSTNYSRFGQMNGAGSIAVSTGETLWLNGLDFNHNFLAKILSDSSYASAVNALLKDPSAW